MDREIREGQKQRGIKRSETGIVSESVHIIYSIRFQGTNKFSFSIVLGNKTVPNVAKLLVKNKGIREKHFKKLKS